MLTSCILAESLIDRLYRSLHAFTNKPDHDSVCPAQDGRGAVWSEETATQPGSAGAFTPDLV